MMTNLDDISLPVSSPLEELKFDEPFEHPPIDPITMQRLDSLALRHRILSDTSLSEEMDIPFLEASVNAEAHSQQTLNAIGEILDRKTSVAQIMSATVENLNHAFEQRDSAPEEHIFNLFRVVGENGDEMANITKLIKVLKSFGLRESDPRLKQMMMKIKSLEEEDDDTRNFHLSREKFIDCIHPSVQLISKALRNHLIIPSWTEFCGKIKDIFESCYGVDEGEVASYIPQLARQEPGLWGMSICTIDGQRISFGDSTANFCVQSVSKAFNYAIVSSDLTAEFLHTWVGHEPSGRLFNEICLDASGKPHNPMINAGAIIVTSLIRSGASMADRFDFVLEEYKKIAGGEHIGFNNATFLSERDTADRNYALSYYMKENKCFPPGTQVADDPDENGKRRENRNREGLREELDLYFQLCSLETHCDTAAVMAATLANGGVCPLTDELCIQPRPCRDVLSLMYSCGMYDYSGKFAFQVGLPAKSGVSGCMIVVVPNLMGIALFSPRLDRMGNSARGVAFCQKLIETFNFHNYDSLLHADSKKLDPRRRIGNRDSELIVALMFSVKNGDIEAVKRMKMQGHRIDVVDYDGRTALHLAAAEGHFDIVKFLVEKAKVNPFPLDRWGRSPIDDARQFRHEKVMEYLLGVYVLTRENQSKSNSVQGTPRSHMSRIFSPSPETPDMVSIETSDNDEETSGPPSIDESQDTVFVAEKVSSNDLPQLRNGVKKLSVHNEEDEQFIDSQ